jgi:hypothetical protein
LTRRLSFFALFPLSLLWANNFGWLAVAFVVRGLKEFGEPARRRSSLPKPVSTFAPAPTALTTSSATAL